jgi:hypothetical protein
MTGIKRQLVKFLLWASERPDSATDQWTVKEAFRVSVVDLRSQLIDAFKKLEPPK